MVKDKTTRKQRVKKAEKDFKKHVKDSKRKKAKHVRKDKALKEKMTEEMKFRQHMARLLNSPEI